MCDFKKPPLGVVPANFYERKRIEELLRALVDYCWFDLQDNIDVMIPWSKELTARLEGLKRIIE